MQVCLVVRSFCPLTIDKRSFRLGPLSLSFILLQQNQSYFFPKFTLLICNLQSIYSKFVSQLQILLNTTLTLVSKAQLQSKKA